MFPLAWFVFGYIAGPFVTLLIIAWFIEHREPYPTARRR